MGTRTSAGPLSTAVPGFSSCRRDNEPPQRRRSRKEPESAAARTPTAPAYARIHSATARAGSAARGHREGRLLSATSSSTNDSALSCAPASSAARAAHAPAASGVARPSAPRPPRQSPTLLTGEGKAAVDALTLHRAAGGRADDPRGDRIEVLPADVVEPIVVGAQEGTDRRRDESARSLNGSCASMEASSITHTAALGEERWPRASRTVW
jgi:hypothetical protein